MYIRKEICEEVFSQYQKTDRKGKGKILDEYTKTLDCNRDYLAHLLTSRQKTRNAAIGQKTGRPEKYHKAFVKVLTKLWELFDFQC
ncbi:MAG: ISNCY family transposase, partial [Treponema sp.]|nr:ISNCY family transposase [Treponema sp.]